MVLAMGGLGGPAVALVELHFQAGPVRLLLALFHQTPAILRRDDEIAYDSSAPREGCRDRRGPAGHP